MKWFSIVSIFPLGRRRGSEAELRLALAYHNVFNRQSEDVQIVLADLAHHTGFYRVNGPGIPPDDRAFCDGMRAAFGRLLRFTSLSEEERGALFNAARAEALESANEGNTL